VAALVSLPGPAGVEQHPDRDGFDPVLVALLASFDRIVARARRSLSEGRLDPFDQHQLNPFVVGRPPRKPTPQARTTPIIPTRRSYTLYFICTEILFKISRPHGVLPQDPVDCTTYGTDAVVDVTVLIRPQAANC
jgi:hypothetical protein